jgi:hypothetical protein
MRDAKKAPLSYMGKKKLADSFKSYEEDLMEPISDKFTDVVDFLTPEIKIKEKPKNEEEAYFDEIRKKRKARYEAIKKKYEDG